MLTWDEGCNGAMYGIPLLYEEKHLSIKYMDGAAATQNRQPYNRTFTIFQLKTSVIMKTFHIYYDDDVMNVIVVVVRAERTTKSFPIISSRLFCTEAPSVKVLLA